MSASGAEAGSWMVDVLDTQLARVRGTERRSDGVALKGRRRLAP